MSESEMIAELRDQVLRLSADLAGARVEIDRLRRMQAASDNLSQEVVAQAKAEGYAAAMAKVGALAKQAQA